MWNGAARFAVALLMLTAGIPIGGVASGPTDATAGEPTIVRTTTLSLTPAEPGKINVSVQYNIPQGVTELETEIPERAEAVSMSGFVEIRDATYQWERGDGPATLQYTLPVNQTGSETMADGSHSSDNLIFVDAGPWAIVRIPRMPVQWQRTGPPVALEDTTTVQGDGVAGTQMAYLGPHDLHTRRAHGQTFRLVVPDAVELASPAQAILSSLANASNALRVGERDDTVVLIAAPPVLADGASGLGGDTDAWVLANESLNQAVNPWLHEYIHTRQSFQTTDATEWLTEATATYHAGLLTLEQGRIGFSEFEDMLERGTEYPVDIAILEAPRTWQGQVEYYKGALVWGYLDLRLRRVSQSQVAALTLFERLNELADPVTERTLIQLARIVGGSTIVEVLEQYTTTRDSPDPWNQSVHQAVFAQTPPRFAYTIDGDSFAVSGPYRNISGQPSTVVIGETLSVHTSLTNLGDVRGSFSTELTVGGLPVDRQTGELAPHGQTSFSLSHIFREPGMVTVGVGDSSFRLRVAEPATPTVSGLSVNQTNVDVGESVLVSVELSNEADRPAGQMMSVTVDGATVASIDVRLNSKESVTETVLLDFDKEGNRDIGIGDKSVSVAVGDVGVTAPGFDVGTTLVAVIVIGLVLWMQRA